MFDEQEKDQGSKETGDKIEQKHKSQGMQYFLTEYTYLIFLLNKHIYFNTIYITVFLIF